MRDRYDTVAVWEGCSSIIEDAVGNFSAQWAPYSARSKRYSIFRLLREIIDPAVMTYSNQLQPTHQGLAVGIPGFGTNLGIADLSRACGFIAVERSMRDALRRFLSFSDDETFVATIETLIELVVRCAEKQPRKSKAKDHESLNAQRRARPHCAFCGNPTELVAYLDDSVWPSLGDVDATFALRLSNRYCSEHRPSANGAWNASYKRAMRSRAQFETELARLSKQSCRVAVPLANTGDRLVDQYVWNYVGHLALYPDEHSELRAHARRLVDAKLTDRKKQIAMLHALGHNQSEVARQLGISRQAVSKALKSIPAEYQRFGIS